MWIVGCLKDLTVNMSWDQFIPSLIATFVGIFVPFWVQSRIQKKQKRNDALRKIEQIDKELEKLKSTISERKAQEKSIFIERMETPIGDGLMNASDMSLLSDLQKYVQKKYRRKSNHKDYSFATEDWYKMIFDVYAQVSNYNILQDKYEEQTFFIRNNFILKSDEQNLSKAEKDEYQMQRNREKIKRNQAMEVLTRIKDRRSKIVDALVGEEGSIDCLREILQRMLEQCKYNKNRG